MFIHDIIIIIIVIIIIIIIIIDMACLASTSNICVISTPALSDVTLRLCVMLSLRHSRVFDKVIETSIIYKVHYKYLTVRNSLNFA